MTSANSFSDCDNNVHHKKRRELYLPLPKIQMLPPSTSLSSGAYLEGYLHFLLL